MAQYPSQPFTDESVPKNTHKGISMKLPSFLYAADAQSGADAGRNGFAGGP